MAEQELRQLAVQIVEDDPGVAVTGGIVERELVHTYGLDVDRSEVDDLLHGLVDEGVLEYHHGEYGEFGVPEE